MKKVSLTTVAIIIATNLAFSQCKPLIKIDGNTVMANQLTETGLALPLWLCAGQTLASDQMVNSISVIEFLADSVTNTLSFVKVKKVSTVETVPSGRVWKVESIIKQPSLGSANGVTYNSPATYTFKVPSCANYICIEVWGGGGGGGGADNSIINKCAGGGGGGGYGQQCFSVTPGTSYTVKVGGGGKGGSPNNDGSSGDSSCVGSLISATGGTGGGYGPSGAAGLGGTSSATVNITGGDGVAGGTTVTVAGTYTGGQGGNGGLGGLTVNNEHGRPGNIPGGGGGAASFNGTIWSGGAGASGKVVITW